MFRSGAEPDAELTHAEAAERLGKKRVAFRDNLVDSGAEMEAAGRRYAGVSPRRSYSASPHCPANQDLSAMTTAPAALATRAQPLPPPPPPRYNRFGARGRSAGGIGGVPARRPPPRQITRQ